MSIHDNKYWSRRVEELATQISPTDDTTFFGSDAYREYTEDAAKNMVSGVCTYLRTLGYDITEKEEDARAANLMVGMSTNKNMTACTDGNFVTVGVCSDIVTYFDSRELKHYAIQGLRVHEIGHVVAAAKDLEKSKIWKVKTKSSYKTEEVVNTWTEEKEVIIEVKNLDGTPKLDAAGNPVTNKKTIKIPHEERYTTATISVSYQYSPSEGARKYILDYFEITDDKENDSDISDVDIFDTQVAKMAEIYNIKEALFGDNADLDYDPDAPASGMGSGSYGMVISGTLKGLITQFYASHPADTLYDAPAVIGGPWSGWKSTITSSLGVIRGGIAHNGTDIAPGIVQRQLIAPSQGIVVGIQDGFPNGIKQYNGNAQRGNFVFVYYGEATGGGVFVLYQHLTPGITWSVGDTIPAGGVIGRTGWSGLCYSSTGGTGEHLHLEQYIGTTQVNPEAYMSS